jgi:hypothetical protein
MRRSPRTIFAILFVAAACDGSADIARLNDSRGGVRAVDPIGRDSAGVQILEVTPTTWPPPEVWTVGTSPTLSVGVRDGDPEYELHQVRGAMGLPTGGVVITEFGSRLRYYDAQGTHVTTLDRAGHGPGEAESFFGLQPYRGDSLMITTGVMIGRESLTQLMILSSDGAYGRNVQMWYPGGIAREDPGTWIGLFVTGGLASLADGSLLRVGSTWLPFRGSAGDILSGEAALMRFTPDAVLLDTIATVSTSVFEYRPSQPRPYELVLDEPEFLPLRTREMRVYKGDGARFAVDILEVATEESGNIPAGRLVQSHRILVPAIPTTEDSREAYIAPVIEIFEGGGTEAAKAAYRERLEGLMSPDSLAMVQDLRVDPDGNIWFEMYHPPGADSRRTARERGVSIESGPSPWVVIDEAGRLLGTVMTPAGLEILEIGRDYILGIVHDEFTVQYIRKYPLLKE